MVIYSRNTTSVFYFTIIFTKSRYYYIIYLVNLHYSDMSPYNWNSSGNANVFFVRNDGYLDWNNVHNTYGLRPIPFYNSCI